MTYKRLLHIILFFSVSLNIGNAEAYSRGQGFTAGDITDNEVAAVYGKACEKIRSGEPKSSTRVRVIDKATFVAAEGTSMLDDFRKKADPHDFNTLIYDLIDNSIEDLSVRTLRQDEEEICVEVTGYLIKKDIAEGLSVLEEKEAQAAEEQLAQETSPAQTAAAEIPAAPQKTNELITPAAQSNTTSNQPNNEQQALENNVADRPAEAEGKALIYIEPTEFYNHTKSNKFAEIIARQFSSDGDIMLAKQKETADYVIKSNVLKAKVDPINSNTSRLQMVVSVELENKSGEKISSEHQNRFVLFSSDEDEQEVALRLMRKLFENACERISRKISIPQRYSGNSILSDMITPGTKN